MKIFQNCFLFLFILLAITAQSQPAFDTIYINKTIDIAIKFGYPLNSKTINPNDDSYAFPPLSADLNGFRIKLNSAGIPPIHQMYVTLGKKYLRFVVLYKEKINWDIDYTYSKEKIDNRLKEIDNIGKKRKQPDDEKVSGISENDIKYTSLVNKAEAKIKTGMYEEAKIDFQNAIKIQPDKSDYPKARIADIDLKIADKTKKEKGKLLDEYNKYMSDGEKKLQAKQYATAKIAFEQALQMKPNDETAKKRIASIEVQESKIKQAEDTKNNYNAIMKDADNAFGNKDYDNAELNYKKALAFTSINDSRPKDQLNRIAKIKADFAKKMDEDAKEKDRKAQKLKEDKAKQDKENDYYDAVHDGDKFYNNKKYDKAIEAYQKAYNILPQKWPTDQIAKIRALIAENDLKAKTALEKEEAKKEQKRKEKEAKELEDKYQTAFKKANDEFKTAGKTGDYTVAKQAYIAAKAILNKPEADEQLKRIDKIVADAAAAKKAEDDRIAAEKALKARYLAIIQKADVEFGKGNYSKAKNLYLDASGTKSDETYPKQKLDEIQKIADDKAAKEKKDREEKAAAIEAQRKYDIAMSKAKSFYLKEDLENAKIAYEEAAKSKQSEAEPQKQLKIINDKLKEIARIKDITDRYEAKIDSANGLMIAKNYQLAITTYKEAAAIDTSQRYPWTQIKYLQTEINNDEADRKQKEKEDAEKEQQAKEDELIAMNNKAESLYREKKYDESIALFSAILKREPGNTKAKDFLRIAQNQVNKAKEAKSNPTAANNPPASQNANKYRDPNIYATGNEVSTYKLQVDALPYDTTELKEKYPGIDFGKLPPEQPFSDSSIDSKDNEKIFRKVLKEKATLNISGTNHKIKLICQALHFEDKDTSVYIKLLIQNNSDKDFLTGQMMLTWTRKSGTIIRLYPTYIFPSVLPVVKPGNEAIVIYVCKSYDTGENEKFEFEMNDRLKKINLQLKFDGTVYNEEFMRNE